MTHGRPHSTPASRVMMRAVTTDVSGNSAAVMSPAPTSSSSALRTFSAIARASAASFVARGVSIVLREANVAHDTTTLRFACEHRGSVRRCLPGRTGGGVIVGADHWLEGIRRAASPNHDERPDRRDISLLVIHGISLPPGEFGGP